MKEKRMAKTKRLKIKENFLDIIHLIISKNIQSYFNTRDLINLPYIVRKLHKIKQEEIL
jgi:hypothetical protein